MCKHRLSNCNSESSFKYKQIQLRPELVLRTHCYQKIHLHTMRVDQLGSRHLLHTKQCHSNIMFDLGYCILQNMETKINTSSHLHKRQYKYHSMRNNHYNTGLLHCSFTIRHNKELNLLLCQYNSYCGKGSSCIDNQISSQSHLGLYNVLFISYRSNRSHSMYQSRHCFCNKVIQLNSGKSFMWSSCMGNRKGQLSIAQSKSNQRPKVPDTECLYLN